MIEVNSFAELRTTEPTESAEIALLTRYHDEGDSFHGGGHFIGTHSSVLPADDGGTLAVGHGFYWSRVSNSIEELNIYHFGAKGDGVTDDSTACKRMLSWSKSVHGEGDKMGVRFPAGNFLIHPIDLSASEIRLFSLYGDDSSQGLTPRTTIISDMSATPVFKVQARRTVIAGMSWDGRADADINVNQRAISAEMCSNQQPFFENTIVAGEDVQVTCFRAQNNGGTVFKLLDTLDTRIDHIYTNNTYGRVIEVGWSNSANGAWDHSTAIELSNANFQHGFSDATLMMPRVTQGILRNVWIKHTRFPGDLNNGQWLIDALSLEDCANPLILDNARVQIRQLNLQSGGSVSLNNTTDRWLSGFETGWRRDESFGTQMTGTLRVGWHSGYRITNNSGCDKWYKLGKVFMPKENQQWIVEMTGKLTNEEINGVAGNPVTAMSSGTSYLAIYRCAKAIYADIRHYGLPAVLDIKYNRVGTTTSEIWVKLKANSGDSLFNLTSTGPTRFESGVCSLFTSDLDEVADLTTIGTVSPAARMSLHNGLAGVGANEKGILTIATATASTPTDLTPSGYMMVNLNGIDRKIAYY
ncbi:glycosyl hydrolase family 28-related protein [Erwinia pyrifoliae]|uniref:Amylovoran biosynthesis protein AmsF n=1 Tax=Erwinia pyrifoliae TaxID=79967 RepID=A0ABY5X3S6_ERWPY|nr:glycosyl hydrolase family 28-related protein [Erwinia pyrifoliae]AUX74481.1 amylovoran biosynthesis protein AmsF [Erwinia pyrifoliae]MCA8877321.1 amylovoran biosynthesis protein AmsF [Erwinia pyrifoliae]UWS30773.1 amylovoran biosynthesis protein AmsF [Erwinia pyrifoliae]UWS32001.1 amylovoran biosynthesis protein AmsF [Erwinia pyrifoliae]UXK13787.1 amylovoran biosynthesis protein AmsF [Erwinia pyrifoliae]